MHDVKSGDVAIPALGFGTWQLEGDVAKRMTEAALEIGYRHIDTAQIYKNEREVGAAIAASKVARKDIFLTTKVWVDRFAKGDLQASVEESLERLGVEQVDLLLLHWPKAVPALEETMEALNDVQAKGWTRAIGLSNFPSDQLQKAAALAATPIATNQVEYHPYLAQKTLLAATQAVGASLTAWSPLAQGKIADDAVIGEIAKAQGKTAGQVTLRWLVQQDGVIAIPRTQKESRAKENFDIFDFTLTADEMAKIHALAAPDGRIGDWLDPAFKWDAE
ncbi:aldo/keto reductase [Caulobacter segnis]|uniref:aldo/keto reductase n=1 Tax=Caulobacter segnis TaxID=88688 RepID=UPI00240FC515|nr:aldo/keto reductase [Caulobacter segnis]MDG2520087.1 aldo/keto reductase [Caulobacter segnis]